MHRWNLSSNCANFLTVGFVVALACCFVSYSTEVAAARRPSSNKKTASAKRRSVAKRGASTRVERTKSSRNSEPFTTGWSDTIIEFINRQVRQAWEEKKIQSSPVADDAEWLRRVYLDIAGCIPPAEVVEKFLANKDKARRSKMIDSLLDDSAYVRNWTTIWTNLCIGRQTPRRTSRRAMQKFFREAFAKNRSWNVVVRDLVTAEGHFEENGAVNYLLAQMTMRDQGVQATAKTIRLFMGIQVQCTQCHDHPTNDWKQDQFWQFNSFFRQMRRVDHRQYDPNTGRMVDDFSELVRRDLAEEGVFFEKRSGLMQIAYPFFFDTEVDPSVGLDRRTELAKLMVAGGRPYIAMAFVNRLWSHFFGYGFTRPIDDMGPHNSPSHPELLERLAMEFVQSRYDVKQLIRWITNSKAYNLTSRVTRTNQIDNPAAGETALFSHMYVKSMEAEQLYDSLIIATGAHMSGRSSWDQSERQRQQWLRQFVIAFGTDENDETTMFNGTIPQALMMMNGQLIQNAISAKKGNFLHSTLSGKGSDAVKIRKLYLATLNRYPSRRDTLSATKLIRSRSNKLDAYQDLFWALLNSNEFIFNH